MGDHTNKLRWEWADYNAEGGIDPGALSSLEYTVPFNRPGELRPLRPAYYFLSGYDEANNRGYIQKLLLIRTGGRAIIKLSEESFPGIDPWRFGWSEADGLLYVWDYIGKRLLATPYSAWNVALPNAAQLVANPPLISTVLSALDPANPYTSGFTVSKQDPGALFVPTLQAHYIGTTEYPRYQVVWTTSAGWSVTPTSLFDSSALEAAGPAVLNAETMAANTGQLWVKGPGGDYTIADESGNTVWNFTLPAVAQWWTTDDADMSTWNLVTVPPALLVPGGRYDLSHSAGTTTKRPLFPLVRYGTGSSATVGGVTYTMEPGKLNGWSALVGNAEFAVRGRMTADPTPAQQPLASFLYVSFRRSNGTDPVVIVNGTAVLTEVVLVLGPVNHTMQTTATSDFLTFEVPIPDESALAGEVLLFQQVVIVGSDAIVSDVFGTTIQVEGTATAASARSSQQSSKSGRRLTPAAKRALLRQAASSPLASQAAQQTVSRLVLKTLLGNNR